jgi:RNA polymerase sigma factor (sigma-70 family)
MKTLPDLQLIDAATGGDPEAIEQLLLQYHPSVTRFARKFCATPEDVEDAVQETLWIATQEIGTLRVASAFGSWLFQVVRHQCFRLLRRSQGTSFISALPLVVQSDENTELQIALRHDLAEAIAALPPVYQQVFLLRDIEGRPALEVAAALGITVMTVKSRLHRARIRLRVALQLWKES